MKKVILLCLVICFTSVLFSQVKVISNGNVGMGVTAPPEKLTINGNMRFEAINPFVYFVSGDATFRNLASTGKISFQTETTTRFEINGSSFIKSYMPHRFFDGTALSPGITGSADVTSGIFWPEINTVAFSTGGVERFRITNTGRLQSVTSGTASEPAFSFTSDTDNGIWSPGANTLAFSTGGAERFRITSTGRMQSVTRGTAAAPAFSFTADTDNGIWSPDVNILAFATTGVERMRISSTGCVGIGVNNPTANLHVNEKIIISGTNTFRFMSDNPGPEIGSSTDVIDFYYSTTGHNVIHIEDYVKISDLTLKANVETIQNSLEIIDRLEGKRYDLSTDNEGGTRPDYGFIAQDVQDVLPELVFPLKDDLLGISYSGFIPILVEAFKEQQTQIQYLQSVVYSQELEIVNLASIVNNCCGSIIDKSSGVGDTKTEAAILYQNVPNPFNETTLIRYSVPSSFAKSRIIIHSLNGEEIKSYTITNIGSGEIVINSAELNPGMYLYTLIVDNTIIDTKRMILTQ